MLADSPIRREEREGALKDEEYKLRGSRPGWQVCYSKLVEILSYIFSKLPKPGRSVKSSFPMFRYLLYLLSIFLLIVGCDSQAELEREHEALIQTEETAYRLATNEDRVVAEISYKFENRTGEYVYLSNCKGSFRLHLERLNGDTWETVWSPFQRLCLSSPITIEAGEVYESTLRVWAGSPRSKLYPQFDAPGPPGVYRIVWDSAFSTYSADELPFGSVLPLHQRISNAFVLK